MTRLHGVAAAPGTVEGTACLHTPSDPRPMGPGQILVAEITDPSMFAMILENAAAIVTELGGVTSHPAIIARELGVPCVVGVEGALTRIAHGARVRVDGTEGVVDVED